MSGIAGAATPRSFDVLVYDEVGSTNDVAKKLAAEGASEGIVVRARRQASGRGRLGRHWDGGEGNLLASILLRPAVSPMRASELGFALAVAVARTAAEFLPDSAIRLKWPNDVLAPGKLSGILLESQSNAEGELDWLVLGIGLNVVSSPRGLAYPTTALSEGGKPAEAGGVLDLLLGHFGRLEALWRGQGFEPIRRAWLEHGHRPGDALGVAIGPSRIEGRFAGLDGEGALILETGIGRRRITTGEVSYGAPAV